tara:strand:- start:239 stop:1372 length:1134 start_codon:yes stop_codon:yes gene_type:complete
MSPKIALNNFYQNISEFKKLNNLSYKNFDTQSALGLGGLSNIWGGTVYEFNNDELSKNNLQDINLYNYIKFLKDEDLILKKPEIDEYFEKNIDQNNFQIQYNKHLISKNNAPFSVKHKIKDLIKKKKVKFISGFVENIRKKDNGYELSIKNKNKVEKFFDYKVVLGTGSLGTTKLLMQLMNIKKIKLLCTPITQKVILSLRKEKSNSLNALLSFNKNKTDKVISHIFPLKGIDNKFFLNTLKLNFNFLNPMINLIKPYIYGIYTYHCSDYSNITIENINDNFFVEGKNTVKMEKKLHNFYNKYLIKLPLTSKFLLQGNDNHIGGSFPLKNYFNNYNELINFKNLFVIDGSYLNYIPPLGYTFVTILNSIRIAQKIEI